MAFINNKKYKEIREAAKNGNEKAKMILQAMRKFSPQEEIDGLVSGYYAIDEHPNSVAPVQEAPVVETEEIETTSIAPAEEMQEAEPEVEQFPTEQVEAQPAFDYAGFSKTMDTEMDGLLDENDIEDTDFNSFLQNKTRDLNRTKKNADYFKAFDMNGRKQYMDGKITSYKNKFNDRLMDIERRHSDMSKAIAKHSGMVNTLLDDDKEFNMDTANSAYNDIVGNTGVMSAFGRHWDDIDSNKVTETLRSLIDSYGKKNVLAALNTLQGDNDNYRDYLNNQVDTEISRYSKSVENLLK